MRTALTLSDDFVETLAQRVAEILKDTPSEPRWLYGANAAADYLGWPIKRVYNAVGRSELPAHKSGNRLMFEAGELDRFLMSR
ncbi:MAG: helix-turn-helix domain-containing protein [Actinomycetota bacterium]|nr:helix-turn-helix domain-containing protein [Actinomycetota bacterium]